MAKSSSAPTDAAGGMLAAAGSSASKPENAFDAADTPEPRVAPRAKPNGQGSFFAIRSLENRADHGAPVQQIQDLGQLSQLMKVSAVYSLPSVKRRPFRWASCNCFSFSLPLRIDGVRD